MPDVEVAIGPDDICKMIGWSRSTFYQRKAEMVKLGVIFYIRKGRPPRPQIRAFPSRVIKYASLCLTRDRRWIDGDKHVE